jgi:hypothetical protein
MMQKQINTLKAANGLGYLLTALVLLTLSCGHWAPYDHVFDGFNGTPNSYSTEPAPAGTVTIGTSGGDEQAFCVQETADKGFIIGGALGDSALVIKTDSKGNVLWTKTFLSGDYYSWSDMTVRELPDKGFLIYGITGMGKIEKAKNIKMMRVDASFNNVWEKSIKCTYDINPVVTHLVSVSLNPNNTFSIVEVDNDSSKYSNSMRVYTINENGVKVISDTILDTNNWVIDAASGSYDSGTILTFAKRSNNDSTYIGNIRKDGTILWIKNIGLGSGGYKVELTLNNIFYLVPHNCGPGFEKYNFNGDKYWETYNPSSYQYNAHFQTVNMAIQNPNGGVYAVGSLIPPTSGYGNDLWLFKLNDNGDTLWNKIYSGKNYDEGNGIAITSDGGLIIAGTTFSYGHGRNDIWLIKTDSNGNQVALK